MTAAAIDQMTQLRAIQHRSVEQYFGEQTRIARTLAEMPVMTEGAATLSAAFADLDDNPCALMTEYGGEDTFRIVAR
jgi:hypothetical protein